MLNVLFLNRWHSNNVNLQTIKEKTKAYYILKCDVNVDIFEFRSRKLNIRQTKYLHNERLKMYATF